MHEETIVREVGRRYGEIALKVLEGGGSCSGDSGRGCGCGGGGCCGSDDAISAALYDEGEVTGLPVEAVLASLGCGNPVALAQLHPGEVVLDLGSGGGIDVLLSARRVGGEGFAYGLDMSEEMLALAEENRRRAGLENVRFLKGRIEEIPLPDATVDVIISNCVVNLSPRKEAVFAEAWRVLKPGGRLAIADVVLRGEVPAAVRHHLDLWTACIGGALSVDDYLEHLARAGFAEATIEVTRSYGLEALGDPPPAWVAELPAEEKAEVDGKLATTVLRKRGSAWLEEWQR